MTRTRLVAALAGAALLTGAAAVTLRPATATEMRPLGHSHKIEHPTVEEGAKRRGQHPAGQAAVGTGVLKYGGAVDGIGVTTGAPKVYLVFWGSQWGTASTSGANTTFSNDPKGTATLLQNMFRGLGTNNELWSGVMTQYCEGVAKGASTCPASAAHVGYPSGGALAGVWYDNAAAEPTQATDHQLAVEAISAAGYFGNTTAASNRNAQYVILSATGLKPGGFNTTGANWCAWHDWNGDTTLVGGPAASSVGDIAFTNMPYVTDLGRSCGSNYVNAGTAGAADGVTIVEGHEYAETVTDQNPAGGWTDSTGYENADKCSWIGIGGTGGAQNITFATGTFAMQGTFSNDGNTCAVSHAIVTNGAVTNDFSLGLPSAAAVARGGSVNLTVSSTLVSGTAESVTLAVSGLPSGVTGSFSPASITAGASATLTLAASAAATTGTATVTVTGTAASANHSATSNLTVTVAGGTNPVVNGGFETGTTSGWTASGVTSVITTAAVDGTHAAQLGSSSPSSTSSLVQSFTVPAGSTTLTFSYQGACHDTVSRDYATATLRDNTTGTSVTVLPRTCSLNAGWKTVTASVVGGRSYRLTLTNHDNNRTGTASSTLFDAVSVA